MIEEVSLNDVLTEGNLAEAREAVKRNKGCAGIDGKDIETSFRHLEQHWQTIEVELKAGSYSPSPVKGILIPKANGGSANRAGSNDSAGNPSAIKLAV